MYNNPRVNLPKPRPANEERDFAAKLLIWEEAMLRYKAMSCNHKGNQIQDNLTKAQRMGLCKLRKCQESG